MIRYITIQLMIDILTTYDIVKLFKTVHNIIQTTPGHNIVQEPRVIKTLITRIQYNYLMYISKQTDVV